MEGESKPEFSKEEWFNAMLQDLEQEIGEAEKILTNHNHILEKNKRMVLLHTARSLVFSYKSTLHLIEIKNKKLLLDDETAASMKSSLAPVEARINEVANQLFQEGEKFLDAENENR